MAGDRYAVPQAVEEELLLLMREGRKIEAIKRLREASGLGLAEAKAAVERFSLDQGMSKHGGKALSAETEPFPGLTVRQVEMPPGLHDQVLQLLGQNQKIAAIKLVREKTNLGLKEAKEAVDAVELGQTPTLAIRAVGDEPARDLAQDLAQVRSQVASLALSGKMIEAIKIWREATGEGLREAKEAVEKIMQEPGASGVGRDRVSDANLKQVLLPPPPPPPSSPPPRPPAPATGGAQDADRIELEEQVLFLLRAGRKKDAHENYILATGAGPDEAKKAVTKIAAAANLKTGPCFIATACYGSFEAPEVRALRRFRDQRLLTSRIGRAFVIIYYRVSPPLARAIAPHPLIRRIVRAAVIGPMLSLICKRGR